MAVNTLAYQPNVTYQNDVVRWMTDGVALAPFHERAGDTDWTYSTTSALADKADEAAAKPMASAAQIYQAMYTRALLRTMYHVYAGRQERMAAAWRRNQRHISTRGLDAIAVNGQQPFTS